MEIILGFIVIAIIAYVLTKKKDVVEANESTTAEPDLRDLPAGTEASIVVGAGTETMVYIAPEASATTPIPLVVAIEEVAVEEAVAEEVAVEAPAKKKRTRKAKE
jgi:hypothetical protein